MMAMDVVANELKGALSVLAESQNGIEGRLCRLHFKCVTLAPMQSLTASLTQLQNIYLFTHVIILARYVIAPTLRLTFNQAKLGFVLLVQPLSARRRTCTIFQPLRRCVEL